MSHINHILFLVLKHTKHSLVVASLLCFSINVAAQSPNWTVDPSNYQYSMTMTAFLNVNGTTLSKEEDKVAAFVGNEVRGVANVLYAQSADRYLAFITVYANTENEVLKFKIYDSNSNTEVDVAMELSFKIDQQLGSVFQAFSLASPALSNQAEIKNFFFTGIDSLSTTITTDQVNILVEYDEDLTNLMPEFIISNGANMYVDNVLHLSGEEVLDFSDTIAYNVLSQDESVFNAYKIIVANRQTDGSDDFKSTNVITPNNDGQNDNWIVQDVFKYSNHEFKIYDANGRVVYESVGYNNDWNGSYKDKRLDTGKYYYVITDTTNNTTINGDILVLY